MISWSDLYVYEVAERFPRIDVNLLEKYFKVEEKRLRKLPPDHQTS